MNNLQEYIIDALKSFAEGSSLKMDTQNREGILKICSRNRLLPIMYRVSGQPSLKNKYKESAISTLLYECEVRKIFNRFNTVGIKAILLRGLYLGIEVYKDPGLRPFIDIDILIEKDNIEKAKKALKKLGYDYSPFLFPEEFFLDAHLHLLYFQQKRRIACEIHWAIDHPFTAYDVSMEEIFKDAVPVNLEGIGCFDIKPELRFILLLIHIQKHLPFLKYLYNEPDVLQRIIDKGELLHILDAYLFLKSYAPNFNWSLFIEKSIGWNVEGVAHATLKTLKGIFNLSLPKEVLAEISPPVQRPLEKFLAGNVSRIGSNSLISKVTTRLMFSPERLPDLYTWLFPDRKTIVKKYKVISGKLISWCYVKNFTGHIFKILTLLIKYFQLRARGLRRETV